MGLHDTKLPDMAHRLTKIVTRTGDDGTTGLGDGTRVPKYHSRVAALGEIDELNSIIGVLLCEALGEAVASKLRQVQNDLFDLGGEVSIPTHRLLKETQVAVLDTWLAELNATLEPLREFILPGGCRAAALAHLARTVCRRAERSLVALSREADVSPHALHYLNRLSDLLFVLARVLNRDAMIPGQLWQR